MKGPQIYDFYNIKVTFAECLLCKMQYPLKFILLYILFMQYEEGGKDKYIVKIISFQCVTEHKKLLRVKIKKVKCFCFWWSPQNAQAGQCLTCKSKVDHHWFRLYEGQNPTPCLSPSYNLFYSINSFKNKAKNHAFYLRDCME